MMVMIMAMVMVMVVLVEGFESGRELLALCEYGREGSSSSYLAGFWFMNDLDRTTHAPSERRVRSLESL